MLDANIVAGITLADTAQAQRVRTRLSAARQKGSRFMLSPTVITELAATYRDRVTFDRLIKTAREVSQGVLGMPAEEIVRIEVREPDPYSIITSEPPVSLDGVETAIEDEEIKKFYAEGAFRYDKLKHLLDPLDKVRAKVRTDIPKSFGEHVEIRRLSAFSSLLEGSKARGHIQNYPADLEALWNRALGWRFLTLIYLANEYRRLTQTQKKGEGSLSDMRTCIEAAYSHDIWTTDIELAACGELANRVCRKPTVSFWNPRA